MWGLTKTLDLLDQRLFKFGKIRRSQFVEIRQWIYVSFGYRPLTIFCKNYIDIQFDLLQFKCCYSNKTHITRRKTRSRKASSFCSLWHFGVIKWKEEKWEETNLFSDRVINRFKINTAFVRQVVKHIRWVFSFFTYKQTNKIFLNKS